jgi:uncharacterized protein YebE (UPF0316 family)
MIYLLCVKIFFARIFDVSLGTFRMMLTVKGKTLFASLVGFIEVLVWFMVVREALNTPESGLLIAASYALGYATGTFIGGKLSSRFIVTPITVQVITSIEIDSVATILKDNHYGCSIIDVTGYDKETPKKMIIIETTSKRISELKRLINEIDDKAFIVINETKYMQNGYLK